MVSDGIFERARTGDEDAFQELTLPYRRELQLHCYRILGSTHDAEDAMQETLVSAWRGLDRFQQRGSLRSWLYQIATNRCLNTLRDSARHSRALVSGPLRARGGGENAVELIPAWLEPYPDVLLESIADSAPGPEARYERREATELAFVAALQHLPPRQRTTLLLRDVLGFRAAEVANMLETSEEAVNSALKRARLAVDAKLPAVERERVPLPDSPAERELVGQLARAFEGGDIDGVIALITSDAWFAMPPEPIEHHGHETIRAFLEERFARRGDRRYRLVPTRANTQPACGVYLGMQSSPVWRAHGLMVFALQDDRVSAIVRFCDNSILPRFGLPRSLPA
jgi:RNA polymerase sigma-70 factor (ECF subfamily)